jgi:hypothetical protein
MVNGDGLGFIDHLFGDDLQELQLSLFRPSSIHPQSSPACLQFVHKLAQLSGHVPGLLW